MPLELVERQVLLQSMFVLHLFFHHKYCLRSGPDNMYWMWSARNMCLNLAYACHESYHRLIGMCSRCKATRTPFQLALGSRLFTSLAWHRKVPFVSALCWKPPDNFERPAPLPFKALEFCLVGLRTCREGFLWLGDPRSLGAPRWDVSFQNRAARLIEWKFPSCKDQMEEPSTSLA
jgi:hypothetical protein